MRREKASFLQAVPVRNEAVVSVVIRRIKEAMINKELRPGDYLPTETELTQILGVSKTSVREAVKMLQAIGVLEVKRGSGMRIREHFNGDILDPLIFRLIAESEQIQDIYDFRKMFEPAHSIMAMQRASEEDIGAIESTIDRLEKAIQEGRQTVEDDLAFHRAILQSTHNPLVARVGETILEFFKPSIQQTITHFPEEALRNHKRVFEAFREKDEHKLKDAVIQSFDVWKSGLNMAQKGTEK